MKTVGGKTKTRQITLMAMLFACALVLSFVESAIPPISATIPGIRLGLSNIVTMYALFVMSAISGFEIALLKSLFIFLVKGTVAGTLSLTGGLLSVIIMLLLSKPLKNSYVILSIFGGVAHNIGQLAAAGIILKSKLFLISYTPILIISGIGMGFITGYTIKIIMPFITKLGGKSNARD